MAMGHHPVALQLKRLGRALRGDTRVTIMGLLKTHGELSTSEIQSALGITNAALSEHMHLLKEADLVGVKRKSRRNHYRLTPKADEMAPGPYRSERAMR